jgi:hypothetical protein
MRLMTMIGCPPPAAPLDMGSVPVHPSILCLPTIAGQAGLPLIFSSSSRNEGRSALAIVLRANSATTFGE